MGRVLALDVGDKRVGVALSDPSRTLARPLDTVSQHPRPDHFATLSALIREYAVDLVVVGLPLSLDGREGPQARRIAGYRQALADQISVPVVAWDERYSTVAAEDLMRRARKSGRRRSKGRYAGSGRHSVDAVAASVILHSFLDSQDDGHLGCPGSRYLDSRDDHRPDGRSQDSGYLDRLGPDGLGSDRSSPVMDLTTQPPAGTASEDVVEAK